MNEKFFIIEGGFKFNVGIWDGVQCFPPRFDKVIYIISVEQFVQGSSTIEVAPLYIGDRDNVPDALLDELLVSNDTSYNSSRPFRWYKFSTMFNDFADTTSPEDVARKRKDAYQNVLSKIPNSPKIHIYKLIVP